MLQALPKNVSRLFRSQNAAIRIAHAAHGNLRFEITETFVAKCFHVSIQELGLNPGIAPEREQSLPVRAEKLVATFVGLIETYTFQPTGFLLVVQILKCFVLPFLAVA